MFDMKMRLGRRVKELRRRRGLSQEELANNIGMARSYLNEVEGGKRNVSIANIEKLALGLGVSVRELFNSNLFEDF